ncbi:chloride channel protein [Convivina intestini]|uniref:chloride channel protein n=1 Tax=Convivina intestini TaxID=1505726 RepID=UPI00200FF8B5|nr:chloride channel protein [Convivina intestini]CAH1857215.1 Voltage-gated ClC-type chloride channel ClcB [Convivina intestini]
MEQGSVKKNITLLFSTVVVGSLVGLVAMSLSFFLDGVESFFLHFNESASQPSPISSQPWLRLLSVFLGGILVSIVWYLLRRYGRPIVGIKGAVKGQKMPLMETLINVVTQIFYVGTGGSVGRELAPRQAGAALAQWWERLLGKTKLGGLDSDDLQLLVTAAAGAGFAGVYIAPITGMLFSIEVLLKKVSIRTIAVSLGMSIIATLFGSLAKGFHPYYLVGDLHFSIPILLVGCLLAPIAGVTGAFFRKAMAWAQTHQKAGTAILWQLPLVALATGAIAYYYPNIFGNGRPIAQSAMNVSSLSFATTLLLLALIKFGLTFSTLKAGGTGGTLTPAIASGAALGAMLGSILTLFIPGISIPQTTILMAAAFLAASQQAPLMAMFMIFEISHLDYSALLPLGGAVVIAVATTKVRWR